MMSVEERDSTSGILEAIRDTPQFLRSQAIYNEFFNSEDEWQSKPVAEQWLPDDFVIIHSILGNWYRF
jgi:rRNA maturation protein Rpf1